MATETATAAPAVRPETMAARWQQARRQSEKALRQSKTADLVREFERRRRASAGELLP